MINRVKLGLKKAYKNCQQMAREQSTKSLDFCLFPRKVFIQTVSTCNANCGFCPYPQVSKELDQGVMSSKLFKKIIDELALNSKHIDTVIPYFMNEPLLDKEILEKVEIIKCQVERTGVHLLSNGSLLTSTLSDQFIESSIDWVGLSVFSLDPRSYKKAMGLDFSKTISKINSFVKKAIEIRGPDFIMITFFKWGDMTYEQCQQAIEYWKELGVTRISFYEKGISRAGNVKQFDSVNHNASFMKKCSNIWTEEAIHILYNGDVILCCMDWRRQHIIGNVWNQSLKDIWLSDSYHKVRRIWRGLDMLPSNYLCQRCESAECS